ncbi:unnamed protein product [Urochloa decumbens]|uniref:Uncharacterized protein n=1 Tax=Urochloa decumbens TaxID=240449 RepID=A0ABC8X3I8_9POAL
MSLRRFVNLVTLNSERCIYSLRRMDMSRQDLFYPATPAEQKKLSFQEMESIQIPPTSASFHPNPSPFAGDRWKIHFFGLSENKIICTDQSGLSLLYDAGLESSLVMPSLHRPKGGPIYLSVPDSDEQDGGGGRLYIMEQSLRPRPEKGQFEAFLYAKPDKLCLEKVWCRHSLPLPPFVLKPGFKHTWVSSYAVLGGGSHLCMSFEGFGTYCFDMATGEWCHTGEWMLPLHGKAEYLPELKVWFGIRGDRLLGVSDLSSALRGEKPELCGVLGNDYFPPDWEPLGLPQIVSMGSGRLCILNLFQTLLKNAYSWSGEPVVDEEFIVFTGAELLPCGNGDCVVDGSGSSGKGKVLQMINHKSGIYRSSDGSAIIEAVL